MLMLHVKLIMRFWIYIHIVTVIGGNMLTMKEKMELKKTVRK